MRILVLNGPNINLLGIREPALYGSETYADLCRRVEDHAAALGVTVECRCSNHEGVLLDWIGAAREAFDAIIINPAAYTHTSIALLDALLAVDLPTVEVHLSDLSKRESFRQISYIRRACLTSISGRGIDSYLDALTLLWENHQSRGHHPSVFSSDGGDAILDETDDEKG